MRQITFEYEGRMAAQYWDIYELSERLGKSPATLRRDITRNPRNVPPRLNIPGAKILRWRPAEVEVWLEEQRALGLV